MVFDILTYCAKYHKYRIRRHVIRNKVLQEIAHIYTHKSKYIRLSALRFFRALIGNKDEALNTYIVINDLFLPILTLMKKTCYLNMVHSALLEIFDYIAKENMKTLIVYLMEKHKEDITQGKFSNLGPLKAIKLKNELYANPPADISATPPKYCK